MLQKSLAHFYRRPVTDESKQQAHALYRLNRPHMAFLANFGFTLPNIFAKPCR